MASEAFTNHPGRPREEANVSAIEFNLLLEDHLALAMFGYDNLRAARRASGGLIHGLCGMVMLILTLSLSVLVDKRWRLILEMCLFMMLALYLLHTLSPDGLFAGFRRSFYQGRMTRLIRDNQRLGMYNPNQNEYVVMRNDGFTETTDLYDIAVPGVTITEHRETCVKWSAVSQIDLTGDHAIFSIPDRGYLIIPRRAFAEKESFLAFVNQAKNYREAARLAPEPRADLFAPPDTRITNKPLG